jgi:hypothetical protein
MSLKVINIQALGDYLTVDNDIISVDTIEISVDATLLAQQTHTIKIPYRNYAANVNLVLWNEIKEVETIIPIVVVSEPGLMVLNFSHAFLDGDSYEVKVLDQIDNKLVWRGKLLATIQTDLENYKLHKVVNNNIYKI